MTELLANATSYPEEIRSRVEKIFFSNDSLKISRSTSTNVYPCEINAKVDADVFDNAWLPLYSGTWLMTTTVNSGGTMTLTWN
ncbi:hypothetical protein [Waltera sp.]|uniref:hypothetical protein n=1 Tax=Waltera sp. TaxID=2815806 RepID=UPI003AB6FFA8